MAGVLLLLLTALSRIGQVEVFTKDSTALDNSSDYQLTLSPFLTGSEKQETEGHTDPSQQEQDTGWANSSEWTTDYPVREDNYTVTGTTPLCVLPNGTALLDSYLCSLLLHNTSAQPDSDLPGEGTAQSDLNSHYINNATLDTVSPDETQITLQSTQGLGEPTTKSTHTKQPSKNTDQVAHVTPSDLTQRESATNTTSEQVLSGNNTLPSNTTAWQDERDTAGISQKVTTQKPNRKSETITRSEISTQPNLHYNVTNFTHSSSTLPPSSKLPGGGGDGGASPPLPAVSSSPSTQTQTDVPPRKGYSSPAIHGLIWEDRRYLMSVLIPVGCGIAGALGIVCLTYAFRNCHQENILPLPKQAVQTAVNPGLDRVLLLADSTDDEM